MKKTTKIRPLAPQEWEIYKELRLRALIDAPDAFGSTLAREEAFSDNRWQNRLAGDDASWNLPLLAEVDGEPVGLGWGRIESSDPGTANLYQVWVTPSHRGFGLGKLLLDAIIFWAKKKNARYLELGVTVEDSPALHLYTRAGFKPVGEAQPLRQGSKLLAQSMRLKL